MEQDWIFSFVVRPEEERFHAYSAAVPEAIASSATHEEAVREMGEAFTVSASMNAIVAKLGIGKGSVHRALAAEKPAT